MRSVALTIALCASLAACATHRGPDQVTGTVEKDIPVPVPCSVSPGPAPDFYDTDAAIKAAPDIVALAKLYAAGRQQRIDYIARLEVANIGCRVVAPPVAPK